MKWQEFENIKIGDKLVITGHGRNKGKVGIVKIKKSRGSYGGKVYLEPFECDFEFTNDKIRETQKERYGFYGWNHEFVNYPCSTEERDQILTLKFSGSEEDIKAIINEINSTVKKIAPEAKITIHTN